MCVLRARLADFGPFLDRERPLEGLEYDCRRHVCLETVGTPGWQQRHVSAIEDDATHFLPFGQLGWQAMRALTVGSDKPLWICQLEEMDLDSPIHRKDKLVVRAAEPGR